MVTTTINITPVKKEKGKEIYIVDRDHTLKISFSSECGLFRVLDSNNCNIPFYKNTDQLFEQLIGYYKNKAWSVYSKIKAFLLED